MFNNAFDNAFNQIYVYMTDFIAAPDSDNMSLNVAFR